MADNMYTQTGMISNGYKLATGTFMSSIITMLREREGLGSPEDGWRCPQGEALSLGHGQPTLQGGKRQKGYFGDTRFRDVQRPCPAKS